MYGADSGVTTAHRGVGRHGDSAEHADGSVAQQPAGSSQGEGDVARNGEGRPRKRAKKAQSCDPCRRRKLKCDRGYPCGACRDRNEQALCTWEDGVVPQHGGRDANEAAQVLQRVSRIESLLERLNARMDAAEVASAANSAASSVHSVSEKGADPPMRGQFGLSSENATEAEVRRSLVRVVTLLPDADAMARLVRVFLEEMDYMNRIFDQTMVQEHLERVQRFADLYERDSRVVWELPMADVDRTVCASASLFVMVGTTLMYTQDTSLLAQFPDRENTPAYATYMREALRLLSLMNLLENPSFEACVALTMLAAGVCSVRPPVVGSALLQLAIQMAFLLDLDEEPPADMPEDETRRRVELFARICVIDWWIVSVVKRRPSVEEDVQRFPTLFGKTPRQPQLLSPDTKCQLDIARIYREVSQISPAQAQDYNYICRVHDNVKAMSDKLRVPPNSNVAWKPRNIRDVHDTLISVSFCFLHIQLHLTYYIHGWDDPRYRLSRDTCYRCARTLVQQFCAASGWQPSMDRPPERHGRGGASEPEGRAGRAAPDRRLLARIWKLCHWAVTGALVLVKHLELLNQHLAEQPELGTERRDTVEDLAGTYRLLQHLAPVMPIARHGYIALQRAAAFALRGRSGVDIEPLDALDAAAFFMGRRRPHLSQDALERSQRPNAALETMLRESSGSVRQGDSSSAPSSSVASSDTPRTEMDSIWPRRPGANVEDLLSGTAPAIGYPWGLQPGTPSAAQDAFSMQMPATSTAFASPFGYAADPFGPIGDDLLHSIDTFSQSVSGGPATQLDVPDSVPVSLSGYHTQPMP